MKRTQTFRKLKSQFRKQRHHDIYVKSLLPVGILSLIAIAIWVMGPYVTWENYAPLAQPEKRIYTILILYLLWVLKFLVIDLDSPIGSQHKDPLQRKKLQELHHRFLGALAFLKKTTVTRHGKNIHLNQLPWYLLIGPMHSGKTALLANANVHYILQRRFQHQEGQHETAASLETSDNCDWWVTRDVSIIDVPGSYISTHDTNHQQKPSIYPHLWQYFLRLIKKQRGSHALSGIIITLPLPEIMMHNDSKRYQTYVRDLFQRLNDLKPFFPHPIPCYIIITKCDLLPGFSEFFGEAGNDEIMQAWGVTIPQIKNGENIADAFTNYFDALIKKLNSQLIFRLHQERNPMARPYIKDFPLQVERIKEFALDFIKKLADANPLLPLHSVYLTSALQVEADTTDNILDEATINNTHRALQIFKEPLPKTRAYFIKQFISHGLVSTSQDPSLAFTHTNVWKHRFAYLISITIIGITAALLGQDFEHGIKQAYVVQNNFADYRLKVAQSNDPDEHLLEAIYLLNHLQPTAKEKKFKLDISYLFSFYSHQSQQKANHAYYQALQTILLPEIKNYMEEYLKNPVNKDTDNVYAVLKAYLMLGDTEHFDAQYISVTLRQILSKDIQGINAVHLIDHARLALNSTWNPQALNTNLIQETRRYFVAMPGLQLSYLILKHYDNNTSVSEMDLGTNKGSQPVFVSNKRLNRVPTMFTIKSFPIIMSQETAKAAEETVLGNWVLGQDADRNKNLVLTNSLIDELRNTYVTKYIDIWETIVTNVHLSKPNDLLQTDKMIVNLISNDSPLLQLLKTVHDNTYFDPVASSSQKLLNLGALLTKENASTQLLNQIFGSLRLLHQYLQTIITADDEKKAAFYAVSVRMQGHQTTDAITQLRIVAEKSPEPIKTWLEKIANFSWHYLMQEAASYIDTSWQNHVIQIYETDIANRYPFSPKSEHEVPLQSFIRFFGNPGIIMSFYNDYLQSFVDTSTPDWHWKTVDNLKPPFSDETLRQIQHALHIHHSFFPNGDNKLYVQFALRPYEFGKKIQKIKLNINDKQFIDESKPSDNSHLIVWPNNNGPKMTSIQLTLMGNQILNRRYGGAWGWFKLVNQSFESIVSKKEMVINFSMNEQPVKYLLFTEKPFNPFLSLNLRHFHLPPQLTDKRA